MGTANTDRVLEFIHAAHEQLAAFTRESFNADGRGVVRVGFPDVSPGTTALVSTEMVYQTHEQVAELVRDLNADLREDADALVRMIETYDPTRQAVVTAAVGGGNPVTIKMKLELPFVLGEAEGVH